MNRLLERQIKKYLEGIDITTPQFQDFLTAISDAYNSEESDRALMNRSMDISSKEMADLYQRQEEEGNTNKEAIRILKEAVNASLTPNSYTEYVMDGDPQEEVIRLAHFLSDLVKKYQQNVNELTEQKYHSDILSHELQTFKFAVDDAADFIAFFDDSMKIVYANKAALAQIGLGDIVGKSVNEVFLSFAPKSEVETLIDNIVNGSDKFSMDMTFPGELGEPAVFEIVTTIVRDVSNRKIAVTIGRDITKERTLESEKDEFVSVASHELRTPMTIIRGSIDLLQRESFGPVNDKQSEILGKISNNTKTLIDLINDMLDLSKLEANQLNIDISDNSINDLVNNSLDKIRVLYNSKGIALGFNGIDAKIKTDPEKFDRILQNLLSNSYKFTPSGGSVVVTSSIDKESRTATISVTDTGIGIPNAALDTLFKKFSQVDNYLQRQSGGTGLGLAICKQLVSKLGGKIWAISSPGAGSKFCFTMPMSDDDSNNNSDNNADSV
jgi:PAS domain S-box-containing protein